MNTSLDCIPCLLRQGLEAARRVIEDTRAHEAILRDLLRMVADLELEHPPPFLGQLVHRRLRELTGNKDPYLAAKRHYNRLVLERLPDLAAFVRQADDPLQAAVKCAVAANAIDMAVVAELDEAEIRAALLGAMEKPLHGDWEPFRKVLAEASDILYLADNAGEIAADRLVIEELGSQRVTLAVRGAPVLNDATIDDAREVGMQDLVEVIDNGSDAPGTILADCSPAFRRRFDRASLVIAKGLGNFETLSGVRANIAFIFKVKCSVVSRAVGLPIGTHTLVMREARYL